MLVFVLVSDLFGSGLRRQLEIIRKNLPDRLELLRSGDPLNHARGVADRSIY